ncbi:MAG: hypothetical protein ABSF67_00310 [Roseiarcus sp.]|jgi:hypothetical protein
MEQNVETLIEHAIANTQVYLRAPGGDRRIARTGLERILADLAERAPDHPALTRLAAFIDGLRQGLR